MCGKININGIVASVYFKTVWKNIPSDTSHLRAF